jgi:molybdate transport system substrate-binding protein
MIWTRLTLVVALLCGASSVRADELRVAAAVSLKEAMQDIAADFNKETGHEVKFAFGASGQLLEQIRAGAPVDAFVSAAPQQVDALEKDGLIREGTRRVVARNKLVLIVPHDAANAVDSFESLAKANRIAIGEPKSVPAGQYAQQVFAKLKLDLKGKLVFGTNVRHVLDYVEKSEVDAGVVYATDAKQAGEKVRVVATAPKDSHDPIVYPAVVVKASAKPELAKQFVAYLSSDAAKKRLTERGFVVGEEK